MRFTLILDTPASIGNSRVWEDFGSMVGHFAHPGYLKAIITQVGEASTPLEPATKW
jgi:hypothetical protein